jgi:hypothetical protein
VFRSDVQPSVEASLIMCALIGALVERFLGNEFAREEPGLLAHLKKSVTDRLCQAPSPPDVA